MELTELYQLGFGKKLNEISRSSNCNIGKCIDMLHYY